MLIDQSVQAALEAIYDGTPAASHESETLDFKKTTGAAMWPGVEYGPGPTFPATNDAVDLRRGSNRRNLPGDGYRYLARGIT